MNCAEWPECSHDALGCREKIRSSERGAVGYRVNKGQAFDARRGHCQLPRTSPTETPRPRAHSAAVMRLFPDGCTSLILIVSLPQPTINSGVTSITSPGAAFLRSIARGPNTFTSIPLRVVKAPGLGSYARIVRDTSLASSCQSIRASSRVTFGAYVA